MTSIIPRLPYLWEEICGTAPAPNPTPTLTPTPPPAAPTLTANNGEGWTVTSNDATHIVTFSEAGARFQSDTTVPMMLLSQTTGLTSYKWYQVEVDIGSVAGTGGMKIEFGADIFQISARVGKHRTILRVGASSSVVLTRTAANVDLIISKVSFRPIS